MKKVPLKNVDVSEGGNEAKIDYKEQIIAALSAPENAQGGTNYEEMGKVLPIIDKVKNAESHFVLLEDAEHAVIAGRMRNAKYGINNMALFTMIKDIVEAPETSVEPVKDVESN